MSAYFTYNDFVCIFCIFCILSNFLQAIVSAIRFLMRCKQLFPYTNKKGHLIIETEKMHSIKHVPNDICRWGDTENMSCEGPEFNHKKWIKAQGGKTNQGQTANKTMMTHSLRKEASALLCEAIQGYVYLHILHILHISTYVYIYYTDKSILGPMRFCSARIEDEDPGYGSDAWTTQDDRTGESVLLRADRWYRTPPDEEIDGNDCSGIRCQIWERARVRSLITHRLSGGGSHNLGYDAFPWEMIVHGNCGEYGRYAELAVLPDKLARYLFEFDSESYTSLDLPEIPREASSGTIHSLMKAHQARFSVLLHQHITAYFIYLIY